MHIIVVGVSLKFVYSSAGDKGQSDEGDDAEKERSGPARVPCEFRGHCSRRRALWLRMAGRLEAGQPIGGDLQGGCGNAVTRANH